MLDVTNQKLLFLDLKKWRADSVFYSNPFGVYTLNESAKEVKVGGDVRCESGSVNIKPDFMLEDCNCPGGKYFDATQFRATDMCPVCHESCTDCTGPLETDCRTAVPNLTFTINKRSSYYDTNDQKYYWFYRYQRSVSVVYEVNGQEVINDFDGSKTGI
jgi:hypothetical protein